MFSCFLDLGRPDQLSRCSRAGILESTSDDTEHHRIEIVGFVEELSENETYKRIPVF